MDKFFLFCAVWREGTGRHQFSPKCRVGWFQPPTRNLIATLSLGQLKTTKNRRSDFLFIFIMPQPSPRLFNHNKNFNFLFASRSIAEKKKSIKRQKLRKIVIKSISARNHSDWWPLIRFAFQFPSKWRSIFSNIFIFRFFYEFLKFSQHFSRRIKVWWRIHFQNPPIKWSNDNLLPRHDDLKFRDFWFRNENRFSPDSTVSNFYLEK